MNNDNTERRNYNPVYEAYRTLLDAHEKECATDAEDTLNMSMAIKKAIGFLEELKANNDITRGEDTGPVDEAYQILLEAFEETYATASESASGMGIAIEEAIGCLGEALA